MEGIFAPRFYLGERTKGSGSLLPNALVFSKYVFYAIFLCTTVKADRMKYSIRKFGESVIAVEECWKGPRVHDSINDFSANSAPGFAIYHDRHIVYLQNFVRPPPNSS